MGKSLVKNYNHIVFSTKRKTPLIHHSVEIVINYIVNKWEHHGKKTFQDEYKAFLKKYEVEYDERYVWD